VKMKRLPQDKIMSKLLEENKVGNTLIDRIAKIIADFHANAETNQRISEFGTLTIIKTNWDENFDQTNEYIGKTISTKDFETIRESVEKFMAENSTAFEKRIKEGKVKDCHGDIHSGNIFVADKVYIFDAIEFNERFRYSDVAADVAFLAMDLDFRTRHDLSDFFVEKYIKYSGDRESTKLLPFYECYRAYVRGKVVGFRLKDPNINDQGKLVAIKEAEAYFKLASVYAKTL
jgi:aminoglycoside phosphotransferase family enzyme